MDHRRRASAHKAYDKKTPAQKKPDAKKAPLPERSKADRAAERARDKNFETVVGVKNRQAPGEAKIDSLLTEKPAPDKPPERVRYIPLDIPFLVLVIALLAFGLVMMYSASYAWSIFYYSTPNYYITRQLLFAVLGLGAMFFFAFFDYNRLMKYVPVFLIATTALMALVLIVGSVSGGAQRWLFGFQPSELAKLATVFFLARAISKAGSEMKTFKKGLLPFLLVMLAFVPILVLQKHLSALILIIVTAVIMIFIGGANPLYLGGGAAAGALGMAALISFTNMFNYVEARILVWRDPFSDPLDKGYQTIQSLYAIASGGLFGLGLGQSRQKQLYMTQSHNDYVFAIVCEELGLVGAVALILLFAALIWRGYWIAMHAADRFGCMLAIGITTIFALQVIMNIAVATNAMPVTGISLPFFSYGGTSLSLMLAEMGVVLSISKQMRVVKR